MQIKCSNCEYPYAIKYGVCPNCNWDDGGGNSVRLFEEYQKRWGESKNYIKSESKTKKKIENETEHNRQYVLSTPISAEITEQRNKWSTCLLFCWFLGVFGVHRFYTGHTVLGVIQLLTFGCCGIWTFIDFIIIVSGNFKDAQGNPIKNV